jgi:hypothetical protein
MQDVPNLKGHKMLGLVPTPVLWLPVVMKIQRLGGSCIYRLVGWVLWREITGGMAEDRKTPESVEDNLYDFFHG